MGKKKLIDKKSFKRSKCQCAICGDCLYEELDVHRWKTEGKDGGKYTEQNSLVLCCCHHRLIHAGVIEIVGVFESTGGKVLIYLDENGQEIIKKI